MPAAHAQFVGVYGTFSPTHVSNVQTGSVYTSGTYTNQFASFTTYGVGGGATLNVLNLPIVKLGLDLRGSTKSGTQGTDTAMLGLKLGVNPPLIRFKFYVEAAGGYLATRSTNLSTVQSGSSVSPVGGTFSNQYAAYEILGGADFRFLPFIDLRLLEVGGGQGFNVGALSTTNKVSLVTINSGVVFHF